MERGIPVPERLSLDFQQELVENIDQIYYMNSLITNGSTEDTLLMIQRDGPQLLKRYSKICFYRMSYFLENIPSYPLNIAAIWGSTEVVKALIDVGFDPHVKNTDILDAGCHGDMPIICAARAKRFDVVQLLVECYGCCVNVKDKNNATPLHAATYTGDLDLVRCLVQHGANVNALNNLGASPLFGALNHHMCCKYLLENGADAKLMDNGHIGFINQACSLCSNVDTIRLLIDGGVSLKSVSNKVLPFHIAANRNWLDLMRLLREYGADPEQTNMDSVTPLHILAQHGDVVCARYLLVDLCVKMDGKNLKGQTAFSIALKAGNASFLNLMLDVGYNPSTEVSSESLEYSSDEYEEIEEELLKVLKRARVIGSSPQMLQDICCAKIRHHVGRSVHRAVSHLEIPQILKDLILLKHVRQV